MAANDSGKYALLDELAEDFAARYRRGERPALREYVDLHPDLADDIRELFPALVQIEQADEDRDGRPSGAADSDGARPPLSQVGDYRILREVGRGGMGVVYEAEQVSLARHVALKLLPKAGLNEAQMLVRFQREARAAAKLHHTNIVPVYEVGRDKDVWFYAMQFIQGQALEEIIDELCRLRAKSRARTPPPEQPDATVSVADVRRAAQSLLTGRFTLAAASSDATTPVARAATVTGNGSAVLPGEAQLSSIDSAHRHYARSVAHIGQQVASALAYAHARGIVHRDIKPSNLLLDAAGVVWVTDFGLAKTQEDNLTRTGDLVGTFRYMAPERFRGEGDGRADTYALGLTLYELLVLRPAFATTDRVKLMEEVQHAEPPRPRTLDPRIPRDLETIILKAIDKEPARRYASADAMANDLRRFIADEPVHARRTGTAERVWRWCRRNRMVAGLLGSVLVLITALAVVSSVGAWWLSGALTEAENNLVDARAANLQANTRLWESLLVQARASRMTGQPGQRFETLRTIQKALALPVPPGRSRDELRTEAIAALLLPDLEVAKEWDGWPPGVVAWTIDRECRHYAHADKVGNIRIRRVDDDVQVQALLGLGGPVDGYYGFQFSPDGRFFHACHQLAGGWRSRLWHLGGAAPSVCVEGYERLAFRPDGGQAAVTYADGSVALIELPGGQERARWASGMPGCILSWNPRHARLALLQGNLVKLVEAETGKVLLTHERQESPANACIAWHPDGQIVAIADRDRKILLLDARTGQPVVPPLEGHNNFGIIFRFNQTGDRLVSNDWSNILRIWDTRTGRQLLTVPGAGPVAQFSADDGLLAADVMPGRTRLFRCRHGDELRTIAPRPGRYQQYLPIQMAPHRDGRLLALRASGTNPAELALIDVVRAEEVARLPLLGQPVRFEPDGGALWTTGPNGVLRWPLHRAEAGPYHLGPPVRLAGFTTTDLVAISDDQRLIAVPNYTRGAWLWQREPNRFMALPKQHDVRTCAISPDCRWVATGCHATSEEIGVKVWDGATGRPVADITCAAGQVGFSPDGRWLVTAGGGPRLWAVGTWQEGPALGGSTHNAHFAFTADGKLMALGDQPGVVRLVVPDTGKEVARLSAPEPTRLQPCCFTADGGRLVTVGAESSAVHIFNLRAIRAQLQDLDLDWEASPIPPESPGPVPPLEVRIELGNFHERAKADDLVRKARQRQRQEAR
jgi:serine/threonine protein kinase/WD40 repeat protein